MKLIKSIFTGLFIFTILYLLCSFFSLSFDISKWSEDTRFMNAFGGGLLAMVFGLMNHFNDEL